MKIFKKLFALTLAVLSCAILFTACDQEKKPSTNGDETQTEQGEFKITALYKVYRIY